MKNEGKQVINMLLECKKINMSFVVIAIVYFVDISVL